MESNYDDVMSALSGIQAWGRHAPTLAHYVFEANQLAFNRLLNWRQVMTARTFTIELKLDLGDEDERYEPMKQIVMQYARDLLANSTLLAAGRRPPQVVAFTENAFMTTEEIEILPTNIDEHGNYLTEVKTGDPSQEWKDA